MKKIYLYAMPKLLHREADVLIESGRLGEWLSAKTIPVFLDQIGYDLPDGCLPGEITEFDVVADQFSCKPYIIYHVSSSVTVERIDS